MTGYARQSTFGDTDVVEAADHNGEFDALVNAFNASTGHAHDGSTAEGPVIALIGDAGLASPRNKVQADTANNWIRVYIDVSSSAVEQVRITDGTIEPVTDSDIV